MGMTAKQIIAKVASAKQSGGGNYLLPGKGVVVCKKLEIADLYKGATFIAELEVLESAPFEGKGPCNAVGSSISFIQQFEEFPDTAFSNTKAFVLALACETEESVAARALQEKKTKEEVFGEILDQAVSPDQICKGMVVSYSTFEKTTKKGTKLTLPAWQSVTQTPEEVAARRVKLGG